jgi:hypothetical protein
MQPRRAFRAEYFDDFLSGKTSKCSRPSNKAFWIDERNNRAEPKVSEDQGRPAGSRGRPQVPSPFARLSRFRQKTFPLSACNRISITLHMAGSEILGTNFYLEEWDRSRLSRGQKNSVASRLLMNIPESRARQIGNPLRPKHKPR